MARVRMIIIDIYPNMMPEAIGVMRGTPFPTGKCLEPPLPVLTRCGAFEREADFGGHTGGQKRALEPIPSRDGQLVHSRRGQWARITRAMPS